MQILTAVVFKRELLHYLILGETLIQTPAGPVAAAGVVYGVVFRTTPVNRSYIIIYNTIYNTIKDPNWYAVQVIRRGGNDDDQDFIARTIMLLPTTTYTIHKIKD